MNRRKFFKLATTSVAAASIPSALVSAILIPDKQPEKLTLSHSHYPDTFIGCSGVERMRIMADGSVVFGTVTPSNYKLDTGE